MMLYCGPKYVGRTMIMYWRFMTNSSCHEAQEAIHFWPTPYFKNSLAKII